VEPSGGESRMDLYGRNPTIFKHTKTGTYCLMKMEWWLQGLAKPLLDDASIILKFTFQKILFQTVYPILRAFVLPINIVSIRNSLHQEESIPASILVCCRQASSGRNPFTENSTMLAYLRNSTELLSHKQTILDHADRNTVAK